MTRRLVILLVLLAAGLGSIYALPKSAGRQESAIRMDLPRMTGAGWTAGKKQEQAAKEREILAKDTDFSRRDYFRPWKSPSRSGSGIVLEDVDESIRHLVPADAIAPAASPETDGNLECLQASIVLSGKDMTESIHRPERCLAAQDWNLDAGKNIKVQLADGNTFQVRRILCERNAVNAAGAPVVVRMLNYYWFVGHEMMTASHYRRTVEDMKDRIMQGYDQRWAYVTVSVMLNGPAPYLKSRYDDPQDAELTQAQKLERLAFTRNLSPDEGDQLIQEFIRDVTPEIVDMKKIKRWTASE